MKHSFTLKVFIITGGVHILSYGASRVALAVKNLSANAEDIRDVGLILGSGSSLSLFTFMHWRRKWQPTPVFLPGESQGQGSLVGFCLWGRTESDTTEAT